MLDRIVYMELSAYVMTNKLLEPKQFCYKKGQNIQIALLNVIEDIQKAIEKQKITVLVLFDFSTAFDRIPHKLLVQNLNGHNWDSTEMVFQLLARKAPDSQKYWFRSNGLQIYSGGFPQESVLSPLLFCLFIVISRQSWNTANVRNTLMTRKSTCMPMPTM